MNRLKDSACWSISSSKTKTNRYLLVLGFLGVLLIFFAFDRRELSPNYRSAYWLGLFLTLMSSVIFVFNEDVEFQINEQFRTIFVKRQSLFQKNSCKILFAEIDQVQVAKIGRRHRGIETYHLILILKNGRKEFTGYFSEHQNEIDSIAMELRRSLNADVG